MEFVSIFDPYLYAVTTNDENELQDSFMFWTNPQKLHEYFQKNKSLLLFHNLTIGQAVKKTMDLAERFYDLLNQKQASLDELFIPLSPNTTTTNLNQSKGKHGWLRLYALKVESRYYVVTGGVIKQSQKMSDHPDSTAELKKLENCRAYLLQEGITDISSFKELIIDFENGDN